LLDLQNGDAALLDYQMAQDQRSADILLSRLAVVGGNLFATDVEIEIADTDIPRLPQLFLRYRGADGKVAAVRIISLPRVDDQRQVYLAKGLQADPATIALTDWAMIDSTVSTCDGPLRPGAQVWFGLRPPSSDSHGCQLSTPTGDWYVAEDMGVWASGKTARLRLVGAGWGTASLNATVDLSTYTGMGFAGTPQTVTIRARGTIIATKTLVRGMADLALPLSIPRNLRDGDNQVTLVFETSPPLTPGQVGGPASDQRSLGVYLRALQLQPMQ
jgi:hypothetical protein